MNRDQSSAPKKPFDALVWLRQCVTACEDVGDVIGARRFKDCADEIERLRAALRGPDPRRIQRKRTKGWRMPLDAIYVGRPSPWGNPFRAGDGVTAAEAVARFRAWAEGGSAEASSYRKDVRHYLGGCDLACWCPLDQPCHADVLLEIANR